MLYTKLAVLASALGVVVAQGSRPENTTICDFYTTGLLKDNNATNQYTLLTLLVNTVVIGNYSNASKSAVPGILAPGKVNDTSVDLLGYFNGSLASTNRGGSSGVAVNFLDDGGAEPLKQNKPANGQASNQFNLLTHLYAFFGTALGCSQVGQMGFPAYSGSTSMFEVHKFMALDNAEVTYFINQVAAAAKSFGVATADITAVGMLLTNTFAQRCSPAVAFPPTATASLQAICTQEDCPQSANATCDAYAAAPSTAPSAASSGSVITSTGAAPGASGSAGAGGGAGGGSTTGAGVTSGVSIATALVAAAFAVSL